MNKQRVELAGGWTLWAPVCVRGGGFPVTTALDLASPDVAAHAADVLAHDEALELMRAAAIDACSRELEIAAERKPWIARLKRLRRGNPVEGPLPELGALAQRHTDRAAAHTRLSSVLEAANAQTSQRIREIARDPRFREALLWQNRSFVENGIAGLLRQPEGATNWKVRQNEQAIATYVQRYCLKSETIGFFGPVGWGRFGARTRMQPGPALLSAREVYFEYWGIAKLAEVLAADPELRPWLRPRRAPWVRLEGTVLHHPVARTTELPVAYAHLVDACDGRRSASEIAAQLCANSALELESPDEVYGMLEELVAQRCLRWTLDLPTEGPHPERTLRDQLATVPEPQATRVRSPLEILEARRADVQAAGADASRLAETLASLETAFSELVSSPANRGAGLTYAGRTLVYEDCRRDLELELGPEQVSSLAPALQLVLQSARWYTHMIGIRCATALRAAYRELREKTGTDQIDYIVFWELVESFFTGDTRGQRSPFVHEIATELQQRWRELLGVDAEQRRVTVSASAIAARAADLFAAAGPGWPSARHHSPDVIIAASSIDALAAGEATYILGEVHAGTNSLIQGALLEQHPALHELVQLLQEDFPRPRVRPVIPIERAIRLNDQSPVPHDFELETGATPSARPAGQVLRIGELFVEEIAGRVTIGQVGHTTRFDAVEVLESFLEIDSLSHFSLLPPLPHTPRVMIDRVVVSRERWTFVPAELTFANLPVAADRFLEVRRWAKSNDLPRFCFYKLPEETKPIYVDFDSPIYVDLFLKNVRRASALSISEMLPRPDECWLADADDHRYVSELRIVAVDPEPWRPQPLVTD